MRLQITIMTIKMKISCGKLKKEKKKVLQFHFSCFYSYTVVLAALQPIQYI